MSGASDGLRQSAFVMRVLGILVEFADDFAGRDAYALWDENRTTQDGTYAN